MKAKKVFAVFLLAACVLGTAACTNGENKAEETEKDDVCMEAVVYPEYDETGVAILSAYLSPTVLSEEQFDWVKEAGLTHLYVDLSSNVEKMEYILEQCDRVGVRSIPMACWGRTALRSYKDYPIDVTKYESFAGFNILDEPLYEDMDYLSEQYKLYFKDHPDKIFWTNCLRPRVGKEYLSVSKDKSYDKYIDEFVSKVMAPMEGKKLMSMTLYPLLTDPDSGARSIQSTHLLDLGIFSNAAKSAGADWVHFVQVTSFGDKHHSPTEADIRFQIYSGMAFGAKGFQYFTYASPSVGGEFKESDIGMIDRNGQRTELYYSVQAVNDEIRKFDHVFTSFEHKGTILIDGEGSDTQLWGFEVFRNNSRVETLENTEYLKNATCSQDTLIGVLEDKNGYGGYVVVNYTHPSEQELSDEISLDLSECRELIVYVKGEKQTVTREDPQFENGIFKATLSAGEGIFIIPLK